MLTREGRRRQALDLWTLLLRSMQSQRATGALARGSLTKVGELLARWPADDDSLHVEEERALETLRAALIGAAPIASVEAALTASDGAALEPTFLKVESAVSQLLSELGELDGRLAAVECQVTAEQRGVDTLDPKMNAVSPRPSRLALPPCRRAASLPLCLSLVSSRCVALVPCAADGARGGAPAGDRNVGRRF